MDEQTSGQTMSPNYSSVEDIKAFRVEIDALIQKARSTSIKLNDYKLGHMAHELVEIHLIEAKMWLGKCLEAMGNPFPPELADKAE